MKKEDLRVVKSKKNLYDSLITLLEDYSFENIKVSDICDKANVNRSTFYDHFTDKYELLNSLFINIQNDFSNNLININNYNTLKDYYLAIARNLLKHFKKNIKVYSYIIKINKNISFDRINDIISSNVCAFMDEFNIIYTDIPKNIIISYHVSSIISVCLLYLYNNNLYKANDIIKYLDILIKV